MQRVAVVGSGGAGKTTFAIACSKVTGLPVVHLDEHFWHPGWIESGPDTSVCLAQCEGHCLISPRSERVPPKFTDLLNLGSASQIH